MGKNRVGIVVAAVLGVLLTWSNALAGGEPVPLPEPGTLVLLTAGLGGVAWRLKKRR